MSKKTEKQQKRKDMFSLNRYLVKKFIKKYPYLMDKLASNKKSDDVQEQHVGISEHQHTEDCDHNHSEE